MNRFVFYWAFLFPLAAHAQTDEPYDTGTPDAEAPSTTSPAAPAPAFAPPRRAPLKCGSTSPIPRGS